MNSDTKRYRPVVIATLIVFSTSVGTASFAGTVAADASEIDIGAGNGSQVTIEAGPSIVHSAIIYDNNSASNDNYAVWVDINGNDIWDVSEPNATYNIQDSGSSEILLVDFNLSTLPNGIYNISAVETTDPIAEGLSSDKTVENQLKVVPGVAPQLRSAVHYDNGTAAEVELAFDENVSAVRTLNVSAADGDANLTTSVAVSEGRVVATLDDVHPDGLEVTYDVVDDAGNAHSENQTATARFAPVTTSVGDDDTVYDGSTVALLTNAANESVDIEATAAGDSFARTGATGANSKVYLFETGTVALGEYGVVYGGDGNRNATVEIADLGLAVEADDATVTNAEGNVVAGAVSANATGRTVALELRDGDGNAVATVGAALDGEGEYRYEFDASDLAAGDYAVVAADDLSGATARYGSVTVSNPTRDDDDDEENVYGGSRDPTATAAPTASSTVTATATVTDAGAVPTVDSSADSTDAERSSGASVDAGAKANADAETTAGAESPDSGSITSPPPGASATASPAPASETGTGVPGFGASAAVAALLAGAFLAGRRDR